jgi:hypothetical protein
VICAVVGLSVRRASPRDDILEVGKIAAVEDNYSSRHAATDPSGPWSPAPLFSVHPRYRRSDIITVAAERGKLLEKGSADVIIGRQQGPVMVITMAIVVAHWAYKFTTLSSPFIQINRAQLFVPSLRSQRITSHSILSTTLSDHRSSLESISSAAVKNPSVASTPRVSTCQITSCSSLTLAFYCSRSRPIKLYRSPHSGTPNRPVERRRDTLSVDPLFYSCLIQIQACA